MPSPNVFRVPVYIDVMADDAASAQQLVHSNLEYLLEVSNDDQSTLAAHVFSPTPTGSRQAENTDVSTPHVRMVDGQPFALAGYARNCEQHEGTPS